MAAPPSDQCPDCAEAIAALCDDLLARASDFPDPGAFITLVAERLTGIGLPILRLAAGGELLHPTIEAMGWLWRPDSGVVPRVLERRENWDSDDWLKSPILHLIENSGRSLQLPVDDDRMVARFPILADMREEGAAEYLLFVERVGGALRITAENDVYVSFAHGGRFKIDEPTAKGLQRLAHLLILIIQANAAVATARGLLGVYLGTDAAQKVLDGNVVRGRADPIEAVIWYSDLADFTKITDEKPPKGVLALLNDYAATVADELARHGGNVLKFTGDGILAVFQEGDGAARALEAVRGVRLAVSGLNDQRRARSAPTTGVYIALHHGELLYGNFGSTTRMDFTVLGQAVNQAARIAAMSRGLDQPVILSEAFAAAAGPERHRFVSLGRYALRGVTRPQELFTLDPTA
ncbi:adenylate/guanylate cyclase domain-containing protein [Geminicoccus roseus]|uniref:adenylate/guanylate cyclase domain-containing protein n=1 Tax=Geminicoccus roseus TaxID=404900 RepID=UPI00041938AF|nr:adenylate/guanylate cyclase domain-containing protein [Geminicoccus roseus]